jgi:hypothetical protein
MPTATGFSGIDVRASTVSGAAALLFTASLKTSAGAQVTSGTIRLRIFQVMSDGSLRWYDFSTNAFTSSQTGNPTTGYAAMTQRTVGSGGSAFTTGIWTYALATLSGFTPGGLYIMDVSDESSVPTAVPAQQERQFQYGQAEGDLGGAMTTNNASTPALWSVAGNNDLSSVSDALNLLGELLSGCNLIFISGNMQPDVTGIYVNNAADPGVGGNMTRLDGAYYLNPGDPGPTLTRTSDNVGLFALSGWEAGQAEVSAAAEEASGSGLAFNLPAPGQVGGLAILATAGSVESDCTAAIAAGVNVTEVNITTEDVVIHS